ncbi:putative defense protein 3 [Babylonia areolata]|uniref:putative defense protein 3 n=1 Tax=Babylonia areolata TaxID=304850 RepID=UPI003FD5B1EB
MLQMVLLHSVGVVGVVVVLLQTTASVTAYPNGAPDSTCLSMFPVGHRVNAMTSSPPFALEVTGGPLTFPNQSLTVTLRVKRDPDHFVGMLVQARMADCYSDKPVGSFYFQGEGNFLKVMDCHIERPRSAVSHNASVKRTNKVQFFWLSPMSPPGHIYFRATVVKNVTTFWTNVFSEMVQDASDSRPLPRHHCDVCTRLAACSASSLAAVTSLVTAALCCLSFARVVVMHG